PSIVVRNDPSNRIERNARKRSAPEADRTNNHSARNVPVAVIRGGMPHPDCLDVFLTEDRHRRGIEDEVHLFRRPSPLLPCKTLKHLEVLLLRARRFVFQMTNG